MKDLCWLLQRNLLSLLFFYVVLRMNIPLLTIFGVSNSVYSQSRKLITWVEVPFQTRGPFPDNYRSRKAVVVNICWLGLERLFLRSVWFEYLISGAKSYREFRETGLSPLTLKKTEHKLCTKPVGSFSLKQLRLTCVIFWVWRCCFFGRNKRKLEVSYMFIAEIKKNCACDILIVV